jgi:UDP-N-acetylmuramoyl-L-alanyl-D-glutamate--2,6-diaminopimelate ligase
MCDRHRRQPPLRGPRRDPRRGAGGLPEATEVGDRAEAILRAVDGLEAGDALLIAGKGHETGQQVGDVVYPFDDVEQASVAVAALEGRA